MSCGFIRRYLKFSVSLNTSLNSSFYLRYLVYASCGNDTPFIEDRVKNGHVAPSGRWGVRGRPLEEPGEKLEDSLSRSFQCCLAWNYGVHLAASAGRSKTGRGEVLDIVGHWSSQLWSLHYPGVRWNTRFLYLNQLQTQSFQLQQRTCNRAHGPLHSIAVLECRIWHLMGS